MRKYSGDYECEVVYKSYNLYDGHSESTAMLLLEVKRNARYLEVNNWKVHIDSVRNERIYQEGYYPSWKNIQFLKNDSLYLYYWSGGQGGNSSASYSCRKL